MNTRILPVLVLAFLVLGCGEDPGHDSQPSEPVRDRAESGGPVAPASQEPTTKVIVTSDDASLPDGCHPRQIAGLVIDFIDAFNRGDQERLSRLFFVSEGPSPPDFSERGYYPWSWYSVSEVDEGSDRERLRHLRPGRATPLLRGETPARRESRAGQGELD